MSTVLPPTGRIRLARRLLLGAVLLLGTTAAADAQTTEELLASAREKYDAAAMPDAIGLFDKVILQLEPAGRADSRSREQLLTAYHYRARARLSVGEAAEAKSDLLTLLQLQPGFKLPDEVSEALRTLFAEVRRTVVGDRSLVITPPTAQVELDGKPVQDLGQLLTLAAGTHTLSARQAGYTPVVDRTFEVEAGSSMELTLNLSRNSATVAVVTNPVGVEVIVDGVSKGVTESSDTTTAVSAPKVISGLDVRVHRFEFVRPCFTSSSQTVDIDKFDDRTLPPVTLARAVATVTVDTQAAGVEVFVDNASRGRAPLTMADVCEGKHTVEMRSPHGRYLRRVDLRPGDRETIAGTLYPAFAFVSSSGGPDGLRGAGDLRVDVEAKLREARGFTLYAPAADLAQEALKRRDLPPDWLAFDRESRPVGGAAKLTPGLRTQLSADLARVFESQGVASVTVPADSSAGQSEVVVSLLAAGSSEPDTILVRLDEADSLRRAIQTLDFGFQLFRPSLGVLAIDVQGPGGTLIVAAEANEAARAAGLVPADRIMAVNGKRVQDALALAAALDGLKPNEKVSLDVMHGTIAKRVEVPLVAQPRAINFGDQSLLFNPLLVHLRHRLAFAANTADEPVLRLNIGIALMRLGNWDDARREFERVTLPEGTGVAQGTVQYHLGLCYEKLGRFADATQAWRKARESAAWLTEDGPPVKELADARLSSGAAVR